MMMMMMMMMMMYYAATFFLEQPEPVVLVPVGTQVELTCRVAMGYRIVWSVQPPGGTQVAVETASIINTLLSRGIVTEISSVENPNTSLIINGTEENNQTTAQCIAVNLNDEFVRCGGSLTTVTLYYGNKFMRYNYYNNLKVIIIIAGSPSSPADVVATENGVESLNISWSLVTIEGVAVNFTVTVMNLNDSSTGSMEVSGIQDQHYIFTLEDSTSCDVYSFQVTAVNGAGTGTPSEIITRSLPSLPDIYIPCTGLPPTFSSQDSKWSHTECHLQCEYIANFMRCHNVYTHRELPPALTTQSPATP